MILRITRLSSMAILRAAFWGTLLVGVPLALALHVLGIKDWDLSIPLVYSGHDDVWQYSLTKFLMDTGWIFTTPFLGAPGIADWHYHAAAQTSALHSVLMLALSPFISDPIKLQQVYYLLNFPLITLTSFFACRLLGVSRLAAFSVGLLFAFTTFRFNAIFFSFLTNYFMVPLALVAIIWIMTGRFDKIFVDSTTAMGTWERLKKLLRTCDFKLGLLFIMLIGASDGYYAFFTLLLLGFATFARILLGDWNSPLKLAPAIAYIGSLLVVVFALQVPLHLYKATHHNEFYPNGIEDPALIKHPYEAEFYTSTLKLMISPIPNHRIDSFGNYGKAMLDTHNAPRKFNSSAVIPMGTLAAFFFTIALGFLTIPSLRRKSSSQPASATGEIHQIAAQERFKDTLLSLILFIFLCSIIGGIGTLIAFVFPTIRAYERFTLFLIFVLYLGAAWLITQKIQNVSGFKRKLWVGFVVMVTVAALFDQIPRDARKADNEPVKAQFLAERSFVQRVEAILPSNTMVYQYPYSQYLSDSKYYGWGSFAHFRLYLHSHHLHWSNGGAKNSPADDWNQRVSLLPLDKLISEVEAVGFRGLVIDRTVVKLAEYQLMVNAFTERGYEVIEDEPSSLTFVKLRDPGFRLVYDATYKNADIIEVTDSAIALRSQHPRLINGDAFRHLLESQGNVSNLVIKKPEHPEIFVDGFIADRGIGNTPITPITDMQGEMVCKVNPRRAGVDTSEVLVLTITNNSRFDWQFGTGTYPIRIGVTGIRRSDGTRLPWDDSFRIATNISIEHGESGTIDFPLSSLPLGAAFERGSPLIAEISMLQESHAWFFNIKCEANF